MGAQYRDIERAKRDLAELHEEFLMLCNRVDSLSEVLRKSMTELFGPKCRGIHTLDEAVLAAKVADAIAARLPVPPQDAATRKRYVREREAAEYMGVKLSTLRAWRLRRSQNGPPFARIGRMVMYPVEGLEEHMNAGIVPRHNR